MCISPPQRVPVFKICTLYTVYDFNYIINNSFCYTIPNQYFVSLPLEILFLRLISKCNESEALNNAA